MKGFIPPYSLNAKDLVLKVNMKGLYRFNNGRKKVKEIFLLAMNYVIFDIVENDVCFVSPDGYSYKIHMQEYSEDHLLTSIQKGCLQNLDLITTGNIAYRMVITLNYRSSYDYPVLLGSLSTYINDLVNNGKRYFAIKEKGYKDYVELIHSKYPMYTLEEINRILYSGFLTLLKVMKYCPHVSLAMFGSGYYVSFGYVRRLVYPNMNYICDKMFKKIFCRSYLIDSRNYPDDDYYYVKISNKEYEEYLLTGSVTFTFTRKTYKLLDATRLRAWKYRIFIKVKLPRKTFKPRFSLYIYKGQTLEVLESFVYEKSLAPEDLKLSKGIIREKYY